MAFHCVSNAVMLTFLLGKLVFALESGSIQGYCSHGTVSSPTIHKRRPDPAHEGVLLNQEVITGRTCFSMDVRPHRGLNSAHVTVLRHDKFDICKGFVVKGVEIMAFGYLNMGMREERLPFGNMRREKNVTIAGQTCGHNGRKLDVPIDEIHATYSSAEWQDCIKQKDFLFPSSDPANSIRIFSESGLNLGQSGSSDDTVVTCAIWSYIGANYTYTPDSSVPIFMEFVAELDIKGPGSENIFRSVAKISGINAPVIKKLPKLICSYKVEVPPPPPATPCSIITTSTPAPISYCDQSVLTVQVHPSPYDCYTYYTCIPKGSRFTIKTSRCTSGTFFSLDTLKCKSGPCDRIIPTSSSIPCHKSTKRPTTASPKFVDLPCNSHDTCSRVMQYLKEPNFNVFSSNYRSASDICKCHFNSDKRTNFTLRKYQYGGFDYGLANAQSQNDIIPAEPVKDVIFDDCLQFHFDTSTTCAIFTVDPCHADPTVTELTLYEFYIYALGTTRKKSTHNALPFGEWELVESSLGNCGDLVNHKAIKQRGQMWTTRYGNQVCYQNPLGIKDVLMGMPRFKNPKMWRVVLDKPVHLQGKEANVSKVYAVRFKADAVEFDYSKVPKRVPYLSFGMEAYTKIKTKYDSAPKWQIISLKTPIVHAEYVTEMKLFITSNITTQHELPFLQLDKMWNDDLYWDSNLCAQHRFPRATKQPAPQSDSGQENTCRCYSSLRKTGKVQHGDEHPTTAQKFFADVKVHVNVSKGHKQIKESCFIFGYEAEPPRPMTNPKGVCSGGKDQQRVLVYFGLTCSGPNALEVMDMTIQAQNHNGYPIGFWEDLTHEEQGQQCHGIFTKNVASSSWKIRKLKPLYSFTCIKTKKENEKIFLQHEVPTMLFFNNNLTAEADDDSISYGYCAWWNYKHNQRYTDTRKNFYFDFQFVATANIGHRPSETRYLVTFRSERGGYNVKNCEAETLIKDIRQRDIFINKDYYTNHVAKSRQCIKPLSLIQSYQNGLCGCFIDFPQFNGKTNRFNYNDFTDNDLVQDYIQTFQQCMEVYTAVNNHPQPFSVVASFRIGDSTECKNYKVYEVLFQALNDEGMPMGTWDTGLVHGGELCEDARFKGSATVDVFKCPKNKKYLQKYKTDPDNVNILHFQNRWMDDEFNVICARWTYPKEYADRHSPNQLPKNFQFYVQTNVLHIPSNMFITVPESTLTKVKFEKNGKFKELLEIKPFQLIRDFNSNLFPEFHNDIKDCLIKYPKPPDYASYSCRMFHPSDPLVDTSFRIDIYNKDPDNVKAATYIKEECYTFDAFPGNEPLSMHLRFKQDLNKPNKCGAAIHFALTAYNEKGFPVGSINRKSFSYYDHPFVATSDRRYCRGEDIILDPEIINTKDFGACHFFSNRPAGLDKTTMSDFYLQSVSETNLPGMVIFGVDAANPPHGICFHWVYDEQTAGQPTPEYIQFYLEIFAPLSKENDITGTVILTRSKKFKMNYKAGSPLSSPTIPAKHCHEEKDRHNIFVAQDVPNDWWERMHNYTIYPDKTSYRKCLTEFKTYKTCGAAFNKDETTVVINPGVVIPGSLGPDDETLNHRYNSTRAIYNGCITSKLCFSPLQGTEDTHECILEMNCELLWAIGRQPINPMDLIFPDPAKNDEIVFELYAATTGWVALGISDDSVMGEDMVFECVKENASQTVNLHTSWNIGQVRTQRIPARYDNQRFDDDDLEGIVRLVHTASDEKSVHCVFYVRSTFQVRSLYTSVIHHYDLRSNRYCILTAYGDQFKPGKNHGPPVGIGSHQRGKRKGHASCGSTVLLSSRLMPTRKQVRRLQIHGALISIALVGALSLSIFVVRYYKLSLSRSLYSYPLWVWIHGVCAAAAGILVFMNWMLIISGTKGWTNPIASPFHNVMGYFSTLIIFFNVLLGFYIRNPDPLHKKCSGFYNVHAVTGHFAMVSGLFVLMLVPHVEFAFVPCSIRYLTITFVVLYFLIHVIMSFNRIILNKMFKGPEDSRLKSVTVTPYLLVTQDAPLGTSWYEEGDKATIIRMTILVLFIILSVAFAAAIAYSILSSDHSCSLEKSHWYNVPI